MRVLYLCVAVIAFVLASCSGGAKNQTGSSDAQTVATGEGKTLVVDSLQSSVHWTGFKVGGSHHGTLAIKSGEVVVKDSTLVSGSFVIDMTKIVNLDLTDKSMNDMLVNHLKSADFFDVEKYPAGKFEITSSKNFYRNDSLFTTISGNLTLKDVEKNITFDASIIRDGETLIAKTVPFSINRTQWGVNYGSKSIFADLKDKIINDEMEVQITIVVK